MDETGRIRKTQNITKNTYLMSHMRLMHGWTDVSAQSSMTGFYEDADESSVP
jgi:hypothetical protein